MSVRNSVSILALSGLMAAGFIALPASAQEILSGRVVDANGAPLPGARVSVPATGLSTATDRQGEFTFPSIPSGEAVVSIEYLGFPSATRRLEIAAGKSSAIIVTLGEDTRELERVIVQGSILDGQARALNQQRTAGNTTSVVSSDAIGRFPDYNVAEALQRVPGFAISRDQGEGRTINLRGAPPALPRSQWTAWPSPRRTRRHARLISIRFPPTSSTLLKFPRHFCRARTPIRLPDQ